MTFVCINILRIQVILRLRWLLKIYKSQIIRYWSNPIRIS